MSYETSKNERRTVDLTAIVTYLRSTGWRESGTYSRAIVWTTIVHESEVELLVPATSELRDYAERVADIVRTLSFVEGRPEPEVIRDLRSTQVDVYHVRAFPDGASGTIPLSEGMRAVKGVHDILLAAATAAASPDRPSVLPSQKPLAAKAVIDQLRLGQTSVGSYVLRVESPLADASLKPAVSARDVLLLLHQAASAAHDAAAETHGENFIEFEERIGDGVSANLCEALVDIGGQRQSMFELSISWATASPAEADTPLVRFDSRAISTLKRAAKHLRRLPVAEAVVVIGRVTHLERPRPTDKLGKVQLTGTIQAKDQRREEDRIVMRLNPQQYSLAVATHGDGRNVRVTGALRHTGRQYEISRIDRFEVLAD